MTCAQTQISALILFVATFAGLGCRGGATQADPSAGAPSALVESRNTETPTAIAPQACAPPTSLRTAFTVITTSRPWCARWVDQWQNETGFLLELRYLGATPDRSGGETFEYRLPPNTTEHAIPAADMPGAPGTADCLARNDAEFTLFVELAAGRLEASSASLLGLCRY